MYGLQNHLLLGNLYDAYIVSPEAWKLLDVEALIEQD